MKKSIVFGAVLGLCVLLSACASVPLTALPKLASIKPETMDFKNLELAVRLPSALGVKKDTAKLNVIMRNKETGKVLEQTMILSNPDTVLTPFLKKQQKTGFKIYRFKMTDQQAHDADQFRTQLLANRASGKDKNQMTFNASAGFCKYVMSPNMDEISIKFYVKTKPDKEFFTVVKEQTIKVEVIDGEKADIKIPYCEPA